MTYSSTTVGRYAPSPTGDLHLGNLRTALLAWLSARSKNGQFFIRMEDLDTPRVVKGSADQILRDLEWCGLDWDGEVLYQSERRDAYEFALGALTKKKLVYPCYCSRKEIQESASAPHGQTAVYSGACRNLSVMQQQQKALTKAPSLRLVVPQQLQSSVGDFVIKRADGLFAYQLAVVVDDIFQGVNEVVRGVDLESSTQRQLYLIETLAPNSLIQYYHVPLMLDASGKKMSKRDGTDSLNEWRANGYDAQKLLAVLAKSVGIEPHSDKISIAELLALFTQQKSRLEFSL